LLPRIYLYGGAAATVANHALYSPPVLRTSQVLSQAAYYAEPIIAANMEGPTATFSHPVQNLIYAFSPNGPVYQGAKNLANYVQAQSSSASENRYTNPREVGIRK